MAVRVRVATELDYPVAGEVCVSAYREDGQLAGDYEMTLRDVASRAEHGRILVAVDESDEVLGCVTFVLAGQREAELRMLAVDPSAQGQGVGGALVQACIDTAEQQELDGLVICVRDFNVNAQ